MSALGLLLRDLAAGRYRPPAGAVSLLPPPNRRDAGVLAVTGHSIVFAEVTDDWIRAQLPDGDLSAPLNPPFLTALCRQTCRRVNTIDILAVAETRDGTTPVSVTEIVDGDHPRLRRARRYRDHVRAFQSAGATGLLVLGRGVAGRWEVAVEVEPAAAGAGLDRALAAAACHLVPPGEPVWAQIAPGNAASVRAFLAAGYRPVGAETLLVA